MDKERLEFFGTLFEDSDESLEYFVESEGRLNHCYWTPKQERRVKEELNMIKRLDIAKLFHFFYDLIEQVQDEHYFVSGPINNSYVAYLLGITNVDADYYELPFERFMYSQMKNPPSIRLFVENGSKWKIVARLGFLFGYDKIVRAKDLDDAYYFLKDNMKGTDIVTSTIQHSDNRAGNWVENISSLTAIELERLGCYSIFINERTTFNDEVKEHFSEEEIYQKAKELFPRLIRKDTFLIMKDITPILRKTEYTLVYQEQFTKICNNILGMSNDRAEAFRKEWSGIGKDKMEAFKAVLYLQYEKLGKRLIDYLAGRMRYTINKGYVIGEMSSHKYFEKE